MENWLFVVGVSLEISGAILVAGDLVLARSSEVAMREMTFPSSGRPLERSQQGAAFGFVGVALIVLGFTTQLAGYIVSAGDWWFALLAPAVVAASFLVGRRLARRRVIGFLHARAVKEFDEMAAAKHRPQG